MRTRLYAESKRSAERFLESCRGSDVVGVRGFRCGTRLGAACDVGLEVADGPPTLGGAVCELTPALVVGFGEEGFAMPLRESSAVDQLDRQIGQFEEPDGVGKVAAASAEPSVAC